METGITYATGRVVEYTYDDTGHATQVVSSFNGVTTTIADNIAYLPLGPVRHLEYGNGIVYDAAFDQQYRMTGQTAGTVLNTTHTLNALGKVTAVTDNLDSGNNQGFAYDTLGRIQSETGHYGALSNTSDLAGQLTRVEFTSIRKIGSALFVAHAQDG